MSQFNCPACGSTLRVTPGVSASWPWEPTHKFDMAIGGSPAAATEWTRTTPHRAPTPAGDVVVPAAQALITGLVASLTSGVLTVAAGWPWWVPAGAGVVGLAGAWFVLLADQRSLLRVIETTVNEPAQPSAAAEPTTDIRFVPITGHGVKTMTQAPKSTPAMVKLSDGRRIASAKLRDMIIGGRIVGLALDDWKAKGWSRSEWETARDILAEAAVATPRAKGQAGQMLRERGEALCVLGV